MQEKQATNFRLSDFKNDGFLSFAFFEDFIFVAYTQGKTYFGFIILEIKSF